MVVHRNGRGGTSAVENLITALHCLCRHAIADNLIDERNNPAAKVDKPRRLKSSRNPVADNRIAEINQVAATTGNDRCCLRHRDTIVGLLTSEAPHI
jgi:integrase/recombinase XerC